MKKITPNTRIKDAATNPIAKDLIERLMIALRLPKELAEKDVVQNLKFKSLTTLTAGLLDKKTVEKLCDMLNLETSEVITDQGTLEEKWWKEAVIYQIYPRSFYDSDGDGIGDLNGITAKLDYLKELGVTAIWCSPFFDSPNDDNGYDIRDYKKILDEFGTMEDFDHMLEEIHKRDMKLIIDLVVNHTSDEHPWFQEALKGKDNPYHDYYIWRDATDGDQTPPNNWVSMFSGSAWNYYESLDQWCLHVFSKKQMDLNWENPAVRQSVYDTMNWWLDKGIDGFRMDVINFISKADGLPDGNNFIGTLTGFLGAENYFYGPRLHEYLHEMREKSFGNYDVYTVGECGGAGVEMDKMLSADIRGELDTVFNFDCLVDQGHTMYDDYEYDLYKMMRSVDRFQTRYTNHCWPAVFVENHDIPRIVSRVDRTNTYREEISKVCALMEMTMRGTPYIYQGQEISMANVRFDSIDDMNDIQAVNYYHDNVSKGKSEKKYFDRALRGTRDNARTPFQWSDSANAGFTTGTPWLKIADDYRKYNAEDESRREDSVLSFYKQAIATRKANKALIYGEFVIVENLPKPLYCYYREYKGEKFFVEMNLGKKVMPRPVKTDSMELVLSTNTNRADDVLKPFEGNLYRIVD